MQNHRDAQQLAAENDELRARLDEAEETLLAIRNGGVDALLVPGEEGQQLFARKGDDHAYRILIEEMSEGALTITAAGDILFANRRFAEMLKMPLERVIGSMIHRWIAPDHQHILQFLSSTGADDKCREQLDLSTKDGTRLPVNLSVSRLPVDDGSSSFCLVATDLTEAKRREEAIVASEKKARGLLAAVKQSERQLLSVIEKQKQAEESLRLLTVELEDKVAARTADLEQARLEAEQANQAKSTFLATMSHEIRTPMGGMLALLELLGLSSMDGDQRSTLAVARQSGKALLRIIDDILVFSRLEAHGMELNLVPASVAEAIATASRLHAGLASSKNLSLECTVSPRISPFLLFDPLRLGQILNNFINNAIKFTASGRVDISVEIVRRHEGLEELCFVVSDTGVGMTPEQVGRLFQPFVQATAETSSQFGGTGLGLVISRRLAELMGGTVTIDSVLGRGTRMTLAVAFGVCEAVELARPRGHDDEGEALASLLAGRLDAPSTQQAQAQGSLLLVVDDHPTNRLVMTRQLATLGYAAETASDGVEALQAWRTGRFAAMITDCNMPRMNGYALAAAIRVIEADAGLARTPIIACTANALPAATAACMDAGMDACIVKPVGLLEFGRILDQWLPLARGGPHAPVAAAPAGAPAEAVAPPGLVDVGLLSEVCAGDPQALAEILMEYRRVSEVDAIALRAAAATADFPAVMALTHRIKGAGAILGAELLKTACIRIEEAAGVQDRQRLLPAMAGFETELLRLHKHLGTFPAGQDARLSA